MEMRPDPNTVSFTGLYVKVYNENLEGALKKLKKMIKRDELMLRIQETTQFTKPSMKKRDKRNRAKARQRHETRRQSM